jgi:hypothetical protein
MTELQQLKENQKANRIKQVKIATPIGGALIGYLYSRGALPMQYAKTPTKKQMIVSIVIGTLIGFGVSYLGVKKIQNEK